MYSRPASLLHSIKACAFWGVFISKQGHSKGETMALGIHLGLPHWVPREAILRNEIWIFFIDLKIKWILFAPLNEGHEKFYSWNLLFLAYSIHNVRSPKKSAFDVQNVIVLPQWMSLWSQTFWPKVDKKIWLKRGPFFGWRMHFSSNIFFLRSAKNEQKNSFKRKHLFKAGSEEYVFLQLWHIPNCLYLLFSFFFFTYIVGLGAFQFLYIHEN